MINEVLYCERLMFLEWTQKEFADNAYTLEAHLVHALADVPGGTLPEPAPNEETPDRPYVARLCGSPRKRLGLTAKIDVVEGTAGGIVVPIEYKRGKVPFPEGAYLPERAQLERTCFSCASMVTNAIRPKSTSQSKKRVPILIDQTLLRGHRLFEPTPP